MTTDIIAEKTSDLQVRWPEPKQIAEGQGVALNPARVSQLADAIRQELAQGEILRLVAELGIGSEPDHAARLSRAAWEKLGLLHSFGGHTPYSRGWNAALSAARELISMEGALKAGEEQTARGKTTATAGDGDALVELMSAVYAILPYLTFTIGPDSPGHHPTMPSAVARLRAAVEKLEKRA